MYTTVPRPVVIDHNRGSDEPLPQIIDHRRSRKENLPYDTLRKHRDSLLESEFKYKKTIKELEKEREELVVTYENTYQENRQLKSILEHGPDAVKMKQLSKDKRQQEGLIDRLQEENKQLGERLKQLEYMANPARNDILEKNWKESLDKVRRKRAEEDAIPTQGPFAGGKLFKKKRIAIDDTRLEELDTYDLQLDTIQKETQVLLNKVKQLKREKDQIDYTLLMGKGAVSRNTVVANAISEKLNRDLNKYAIRLEKLKIKHKSAKMYVDEARILLQEKSKKSKAVNNLESDMNETQMENEQMPDMSDSSRPTKKISYKTKPANKSEKERKEDDRKSRSSGEGNLPGIVAAPLGKPNAKATHVPEKDNNWIPSKHFERPDTYSELHQKTAQHAEDNSGAQAHYMLGKGQTLNDNFRDDMRIQKTKHRIKTSSQGIVLTQMKTTKAQALRDTWVKNKKVTSARSDPEQVKTRKRPRILNHSPRVEYREMKEPQNTLRWNPTILRNNLVGDNETYDDVLDNLRKQSNESDTNPRLEKDFQKQRNRRRHSISPVPINFTSDGRYVHRRDDVYLMGNTGIRNRNYYRYN